MVGRFQGARSSISRLPSRPDLRAFNARRDQAEFASRLADGEWKPSLAFRGNIQYQEDSFGNVLDSDNQNYTFGLAVQMPLMAAPGAAARRAAAQAQKRQAEYGLNASTDQARLSWRRRGPRCRRRLKSSRPRRRRWNWRARASRSRRCPTRTA